MKTNETCDRVEGEDIVLTSIRSTWICRCIVPTLYDTTRNEVIVEDGLGRDEVSAGWRVTVLR